MTVRVPVRSWRAAELGGLDLLHGSFTGDVFARHTHDTYSVGLLGQGAMAFTCRGGLHTLRPGLVGIIHPDEVHTGHAETPEGWTYRNFFPSPELLGDPLGTGTGPAGAWPRLPVVIDDPALWRALVAAHAAFEGPGTSLARESLMRGALASLVARHAAGGVPRPPSGASAAMNVVARARELLEDEFARNVTLDELAAVAGVNAFTLLRAFRRRYGLPPHAYQLQVRLRRARALLRAGETTAQAALLAGFADQSHFGRHFRRTFGVTPARYRRGVRNVLVS